MVTIVLGIALLLVVVIVAMIFRIQGIASTTTSNDNKRGGLANRVNGALMLGFLIGGGALFVWSFLAAKPDFLPEASSIHGKITDGLFWLTMTVLGIAFVGTHILLFYFPWKYQFKLGRKAHFYPDNDKLEIAWTVIPAIVLTLLIFSGWRAWRDITSKAPDDAVVVEMMGKQFNWMTRYPGKNDYKLGEVNFRMIDNTNEWGLNLGDEASFDDFMPLEVHVPVNKPVLFKIRSRDVLHSFSIPHLRVKMDAVPGMPTSFWCTPTKTTEQMRNDLGKPDFKYEIACQEVCGKAHFAMKFLLVVETEEEYNKWYGEQRSFLTLNPDYLQKVPGNLREKAIKAMNLTPEETAKLTAQYLQNEDATASLAGGSASLR